MSETTAPEVADEVVDRAEISNGNVLVAYSRTEAAIAELKARYSGARFDLTTTAGDRAARAARLELVRLRTSLDAKRKDFKAPALEFGRRIDSEAKRLEGEILALETPIDEQIKAEESRRAAEKAERDRIEAARVAEHMACINEIRAAATGHGAASSASLAAAIEAVAALDVSAERYEEFAPQAVAAQAQTLATLTAMHAGAVEREAEAARLAAERAELARVAAEQAAERKRLADEAAAAAAARAAADRLAAEQRAEADRIAREAREAEEARQATARVELERQQAELAAQREQEAARIAEQQRQQAEAERQAAAALAAAAAPAPLPVSEPVRPSASELATLFAPQPDRALFPVHPMPTAARASVPASAEPVTLNLGAICARLGFAVRADFITGALGITPAAIERGLPRFRESQWPLICAALVRHVNAVCELQAA
jgi:hypothetical protein